MAKNRNSSHWLPLQLQQVLEFANPRSAFHADASYGALLNGADHALLCNSRLKDHERLWSIEGRSPRLADRPFPCTLRQHSRRFPAKLQVIQRAARLRLQFANHMRVNHRRLDALVAQKFLDFADIRAVH